METLLNALWVAICMGLVFAWHGHWLSQIRRRVHADAARQSFVSLICLLALLFPAISLSDDLHAVVLALPDTKSSSVAALSHSHSAAHNPSDTPQSTVGLPGHGFAHPPLVFAHLIESGSTPAAQLASFSGPVSGRAPPAIL
jgi:hypothetical protein